MSTVTSPPRYTPDDLLRMPDGGRHELVDGELVERKMSTLSSFIAGELHRRLSNHCHEKRLGWAFPEGTGYRCFPEKPMKVRRADTSFVRGDRLSARRVAEEGFITVAPDVAAEVVSTHDLYYEVEAKADEWLEAGVHLVWVLNPRTREIRIHRVDGTETTLGPGDELAGEEVVPGFRCALEELFQPLPGEVADS